MAEMTDVELGWLAGLLEGEGYFGTQRQRGRSYIRIVIASTDLDVLERAESLMSGRIRKRASDPRQPAAKPVYAIDLSGHAAYEVMKTVLPLMGKRRSGQISKALKADGRWPSTVVPSRSGKRKRS